MSDVINGLTLSFTGTVLQGPPGEQGEKGEQGNTGNSAYQSYTLTTDDVPVLTEAEWVASLHGDIGATGPSAYQSYLNTTTDKPVLTEAQWIASLHGKDGVDGKDGTNGKDGTSLNNRGAWVTGQTYTAGDYVFAPNASGASSMWILIGDDYLSTTEPVNDTAHWVEFEAPAGADGKDGKNGTDGRGITSSATTYQAGTSGTTIPTGTWTTAVPTVSKGAFLWTRTIFTYSDATTSTAYSVAYQGADGSGGGTGGTTTLLLTTTPTASDGADGSIAICHTANGYISTWSRSGTTWTKVWEMALAQTSDAQAATNSLIPTTPAGVREYMEQFGLTSTYTNTVADLNTVVKGQMFNWSNTSANSPVANSYGRGICIPAGTGYVTQLGIINDTGATYVRFQSGSSWSAWIQIGPSSGSGSSSGAASAFMNTNVGLNNSSFTKLGMSGGVMPVTGKFYQFKATILTQANASDAATFSLKWASGIGAQVFRMACNSQNAGGVIATVVTDQMTSPVTGSAGAGQNGIVTLEGIVQFNYLGSTQPDLEMKLLTGSYMNILAGSGISYTLLGTPT